MKAIDTNILVRLIARDDPGQVVIAEQVLSGGAVLILPTVLLECEWVLRSRYKLPRDRIAVGLIDVCGLSGVHVASEPYVSAALSRFTHGGDFADLLHLELAREDEASAFVTFDRALAKDAIGELPIEVV